MIYFIIWLVVFIVSWFVATYYEYNSLAKRVRDIEYDLHDPVRLKMIVESHEEMLESHGWAPKPPSKYELRKARERVTSVDSYYGIAIASLFWPAVVALVVLAALIIGAYLLGKYLVYIPVMVIVYLPFLLIQRQESKLNLLKKLILKLHDKGSVIP